MAVVSVAGAAFTVDIASVGYEDQVTSGTISFEPTIVRTKTLSDVDFTQTDLNTTGSIEFLYDENSGMYEALYTAVAAGNSVALDIRSASGHWAGNAVMIDSLEANFEAAGVATATFSFTGTFTFS